MREEMGGGVSFKYVGFLDLTASARDMHLGLADFDLRKLCRGRLQNRIVSLAGLTGGKAVSDDRTGAVGEFFVVGVADVFDDSAHHEC